MWGSLCLCLFSLKHFIYGLVHFKDHVRREILLFALLLVKGPIRREQQRVFVVVVGRRNRRF